jgi:hypothetical protein
VAAEGAHLTQDRAAFLPGRGWPLANLLLNQEVIRMRVLLWIIGIIFLIGLLVVSGVLKAIF